MASAENENRTDVTEQDEMVEEQQFEVEEETLNVSRISVLSQSFEPRLSSIPEELDASMESPASEEATPATAGSQYERIEKLARPKATHLEETLKSHGNRMDNGTIERLKGLIKEIRGTEKLASTELQPATIKLRKNSKIIYNNLQCRLRKVAFETLANRIYDKMPQLIVKMQQNRPQQFAPETQLLYETLQATLQCYLGMASNEHEERIFNQLCYGLAKFVEDIIENVHKEQQQRDDKEEQQDKNVGKFRYPVAVELGRKAYKEHQMRSANNS